MLRQFAGHGLFVMAAPSGGTTLIASWLVLALAALTFTGRAEVWRVFSVLSVTMALEGVLWQAVMFGAALVFEEHIGASVLLIGLAT